MGRLDQDHVAGGEGGDQPRKLAPVGPRARYLLAVNLAATRGAQLLKLNVERLPVASREIVCGLTF